MKVDISMMWACFHGAQRAGCVYRFGAKPYVNADSSTVVSADCSGMSRWLLTRATNQAIIAAGFPDGSAAQREWCQAQGLHVVSPYSNLHFTTNDPTRLFIAFEDAGAGHPGHVWLVNAGRTLESHGPRGSHLAGRAWDSDILTRIVDYCFELPA